MQRRKLIVRILWMAVIVLVMTATNRNTERVQAYEVSGFYQYDMNETGITITKYTGGEITVSIPSKLAGKNVTVIGENAFADNEHLEHVSIPKTITTIKVGAFKNCSSLVEITIPDSVTQFESRDYGGGETFGDCDNLTTVVIGDNVSVIGSECFSNCPKLQKVTIGKKVENIEYRAFNNCSSLVAIDIPKSVKTIGEQCFTDCKSLKTINLSEGLTYIGYGAFRKCDSLEAIIIPDSVIKIDSRDYSDGQTFGGCANLTSVVIGDGLRAIGAQCFSNCPRLQKVTIGEMVETIDYQAFANCTSLTSINIPESVKSLGEQSFINCTSLRSVNLSWGLSYIGCGAFQRCGSLEEVIIPNSVITIDSRDYSDGETFGSCGNLRKLQIPNSVTTIGGDVVEDSNNAVIYGYSNSVAAKYATNNKLIFLELDSVVADSIKFSKSEVTLLKGQTKKIDYIVNPINTTDAIIWKSSDANIVSIDNVGKITAKSTGSVSVIAETTSGKKASITIIAQAEPNKISFKTSFKTLLVGKSYSQKALLDDGSRTDVSISYYSNDNSIATVSADGKVEAKKAGVVTITAEIYNGLKSTYQVDIKKAPESVSISPSKITLRVKNTYVLQPVVPRDSYSPKYTYVSSNSKVVAVSTNGKLVAKKKGTATITVTTHNGKKASCKITVK